MAGKKQRNAYKYKTNLYKKRKNVETFTLFRLITTVTQGHAALCSEKFFLTKYKYRFVCNDKLDFFIYYY